MLFLLLFFGAVGFFSSFVYLLLFFWSKLWFTCMPTRRAKLKNHNEIDWTSLPFLHVCVICIGYFKLGFDKIIASDRHKSYMYQVPTIDFNSILVHVSQFCGSHTILICLNFFHFPSRFLCVCLSVYSHIIISFGINNAMQLQARIYADYEIHNANFFKTYKINNNEIITIGVYAQ